MADEATPKAKRKRAKRPGAKRTSKMKREKRKAHRAKLAAAEELEMDIGRKGKMDKALANGEQDKEVKLKVGKKRKKKLEDDEGADQAGLDLQNRVIVRGLPTHTDEKALRADFSECGKVRSVRRVVNTRLVFKGIAFVSFKDEAGVEAALGLDGTEYGDSVIRVEKALPPTEAPNFRVFIGSLPYEADAETVEKDFTECGKISKFRLLKDARTGSSKGVAFATYVDQDGVANALKYDGTEYGGRKIVVRLFDRKRRGDDGATQASGKVPRAQVTTAKFGGRGMRRGGKEGAPRTGRKLGK